MSKERLPRLVPPLAAAAGGLAVRLYYRHRMQEQAQQFREDLYIAHVGERMATEKADEYRLETLKAKEAELRAKAESRTDPLTRLPNRRRFDEECIRIDARTKRYPDRKNSLLMLDLDRLKETNDTYGHHAGDDLIRKAGGILQAQARSDDLPARIGGDEMAIIMQDTGEKEAAVAAERLLDALADAEIHATIGVAEFERWRSTEETVRLADCAMYHGKEHEGNQVIRASSLAIRQG